MNKEHKDSEQQQAVCQKTDIIGQLAGGMSHNFNNQLTGIMGFATLISMRSTDDNIKKFADEIIGVCKKAGDMVMELLTFARYRPLCASGINVHHSIAIVTNLLSNSIDKRIVIEHKLNAENYTITADAVQFQSMLLNLALNSKDSMPRGGQIAFITETVNTDTSGFLKITVSDTGSGFSDEIKERMFEPLFTTKGPGYIGLGLLSVSEFVKSMHGTIQVESVEGEGTSITITLPTCAETETKPTLSPAADGKNDTKKEKSGRILLVDDDKSIRDSIYAFLKGLNYQVFIACDGLDAVEKYELLHNDINLVILDMVMPHMDGKDAFVKMKEINPELKAIGITGFTKYNSEEMTALGLKKILHKPFSFDELSGVIAEYI